jgi:hypothetical protein
MKVRSDSKRLQKQSLTLGGRARALSGQDISLQIMVSRRQWIDEARSVDFDQRFFEAP